MKDYREIHMSQIKRERRAILVEGATTEQFINGCNAKRYPPGSVFLWAVGIAGPVGSAEQKVA